MYFFKHKFLTTFACGLAFFLGSFSALAGHETSELNLFPGDESDACDVEATQIRVTVHGVAHGGIMKLELYNDPDLFTKKEGRLRRVRVPAMDAPQLICMNVEAGIYAVTGYHDKDGDRKLDKKWNFTPKEPLGISNNIKIKKRRIPKFEEAQFDVGPKGTNIDLNLVDVRAAKKQREAEEKAREKAEKAKREQEEREDNEKD